MRYFRFLPWGFQVLLFLGMVVFAFFAAQWTELVLFPLITHTTADFEMQLSPDSPMNLIHNGLLLEGMTSFVFFVVPALFFAYATHPRPLYYLGFKRPGNWVQPVLVVFVMLGALPLLNEIGDLMSHIPLSKALSDQQALNDRMFGAFLKMPDPTALGLTLFTLAVLPAVGEEMFFRGVLMKLSSKRSQTIAYPIVFTASIFALAHLNIYGLPSIFLAGILLAFLYYITGSLWCSILAHCLFNGTQILLTYGAGRIPALKHFAESGQNSIGFLLVAGVVFAAALLILISVKTPLQPGWNNDFLGEKITDELPGNDELSF